MSIWIPNPIYRLFPAICISVGVGFFITAEIAASAVLSVILILYGAGVMATRVAA